ncbi:MAG: response regulator, partial [bacterium]|nr:response regulator [bacterium]
DNIDEIDLVLLDMVMPNMAGKETYLEMRNIQPDVKVILASGYSQEGKANEILEEGVLGFVQKPFMIRELSTMISKTLAT